MLIDALGDLLGKSFEPFEGEWADKPLVLLMKEMELANQSTANQNVDEQPPNHTAVGLGNEQEAISKAEGIESIVEILKGLQIAIEEVLLNSD